MLAQLAARQLWCFLTSKLLDVATFLPGDGIFLLHRGIISTHTFANNIRDVGCCTAVAARGGDEHR